MEIFSEIDSLCCDRSQKDRGKLEQKLEEIRLLALGGAIRYDLYLRLVEMARAARNHFCLPSSSRAGIPTIGSTPREMSPGTNPGRQTSRLAMEPLPSSTGAVPGA